MKLADILCNIYPLSDESVRLIEGSSEEITAEKGTDIIRAGAIERYLYFVKSGAVRAYIIRDGKDITFWLGTEGSVAVSLDSYIRNQPGYESIRTIEQSVLFRIPIDILKHLYHENLEISNWGRKFAELEILRAEQSLIPQLYETASVRYVQLLRNQPDLIKRIPLEHLATYLGVTPVSLSRIRASITQNDKTR